jgi:hypothetical protein
MNEEESRSILTSSSASSTTPCPDVDRRVVKLQLEYWYGRDGDVDLAGKLHAVGCPDFAERVRRHIQAIGTFFLPR